MEKMTGETLNITKENIKVIAEHFPEAMEEGKIKFDVLKELLGEFVDEANERYQFTWNGKSQALKLSQTPSTGTLLPCKEKSKDWDTTENLYIEGDNLEVLKLLQKSYYRKVKMIYIDPPYNTGNDFVYKDDFKDNIKNYKTITNQVNKANPETQGRYHTDWLNMMYSRLRLAKNLLCDEGLIFISIDDNELFNLKKICDEIFGEVNFVNNITIKMSELSGVKMKNLNKYPKLKETLLIYCKNDTKAVMDIERKMKNKEVLQKYLKYYSNIIYNINEDVSKWKIISLDKYLKDNGLSFSDDELYSWKLEHANELVYRTNSRTVEKYIQEDPDAPAICKFINADGNEVIKWDDKEMLFLSKYIEEYIGDIWMDISTINLNKETDVVMYENGQKPLKLLERIINGCIAENDIVLDFFAGSSTTAHAVMNINKEKDLKLKYIMVQIPDMCDSKSEAFINGYKNLCEIGEERIRRAGTRIKEETNADIDYGFKVFKLDSSNLKLWNGEFNTEEEANNYFLEHLSPLVDGRTNEDLLYELLLKEGMPLTSPIEEIKVGDKTIYSIGMGYLMICLEDKIDMNLVEEIGKRKPESIIFRDSGFADENAKINTIQELKKYGIAEEVIKSI